MKVDLGALSLRLGLAWLLLSLTVLALFLVGSAQSFLESTLRNLFLEARWLSWAGLLVSWLLLVPLSLNRRRRLLASVALGFGFGTLFAFVAFWGAWIYPNLGNWLW